MGEEVVTDLPKVKLKVKPKADKPAKPAKTVAKVDKPVKKEKPAPSKKTSAKDEKKAISKKDKPSSKKTSAKSSKSGALTADVIAPKIISAVSSGKVESVKVDYASAKSVVEGLVAKSASILLKAYSDKNIAAITHGDSVVAKAAKEILTKNAKAIRVEAITKYVKKYSGIIAKTAKLAEAGKLTATEYRAVTFEL